MSNQDTLRQTALRQTQTYGNKRRFGLFSQPISTAIGDDGPYKTKYHPRTQQGTGKPLIKPRNFQSGTCRSGQLQSSFFGKINSLAQMQDEFIEQPKRLVKQDNQTYKKGFKNDTKWRPASATNTNPLSKSSYVYVQANEPDLNPKRNREQDGKVKAKPRNAYTNPGSKVVDSYFKNLKHVDDPYDRAHKMKIDKQKKDKAREGQVSFKSNCFSSKAINSDKKVYHQDVELVKKSPKEPKFNIFNHEAKWKFSNPGKKGLNGCFSPFPVYMEDPIKQTSRKESKEKKEVFKGMSSTVATPSSSIALNPTNIRRTFNNSFSHRV